MLSLKSRISPFIFPIVKEVMDVAAMLWNKFFAHKENGCRTQKLSVGKMVLENLKKYNNNISQTAEALKISRAALYRRMEKYGIGKL